MKEEIFQLDRAPIVEAVVDIDCDLPPKFDLASLEPSAREGFRFHYPKARIQYLEEHKIERKGSKPSEVSARRGINALQFISDDEKQLVQVRAQGFSFNRLAPYSSLDDYLPEIERTWSIYSGVATPVQIRVIRLRYINRILIPLTNHNAELSQYFKESPRLPEEGRLSLTGFLHQYAAQESATGHNANIVLTSQPAIDGKVPVIFDITVAAVVNSDIGNWAEVLARLVSLRDLKNRIFSNTLTEKCLNLFQQQ